MYKNPREGITNTEQQINELKKKGHPVAFVGDVVGTGSSRKSATNSVIWYTGDDIPFVPNKRYGGICIGGKLHRFSSTPWKMLARCRLNAMYQNLIWVM
jgi:aconitate hydratase 2/2-methylisocitrate dehydratase